MSLRLPFETRTEAGTALAGALQQYKEVKDTLVLALVRGGVVVGRALADELKLPLYPYVIRKLGHPAHREYALGAIAENGSTYLDEPAMRMSGVSWEDLEPVIEEETEELRRRKDAYAVQARPNLRGKTVILTDDGAATGASLFAAIEDLRKTNVKRIIVALPVCPPDTVAQLKKKTDDITVIATPEPFEAVGLWYQEFPQVEDAEVLHMLAA